MSADNFVGVRPNKDGTWSIFEYGNMSVYGEDCLYYAEEMGEVVESREVALVKAHDLVNEMSICEYGVVEMFPVPDKPCGRCYVCVHMRGIADDSLERCDYCKNPISTGEWMTSTYDHKLERVVTVHSSCERR